MKPLDFTCSHFDEATNLCCMAQPGEQCSWTNAFGIVETREEFHPERIEAADAMNAGPGEVPTVAEFDRAADVALGGEL